jgi:hypothetical protein
MSRPRTKARNAMLLAGLGFLPLLKSDGSTRCPMTRTTKPTREMAAAASATVPRRSRLVSIGDIVEGSLCRVFIWWAQVW